MNFWCFCKMEIVVVFFIGKQAILEDELAFRRFCVLEVNLWNLEDLLSGG